MKRKILSDSLLSEEKLATKWFLWLFYILYLTYDITYYYIIPMGPWQLEINQPRAGLNIFIYIIMLGLLPLAIRLMKKQRPEPIKYIYFIVFTSLNLINDIWVYWGSDVSYANGNIIELVILLFSPLFINKRFFFLVFLGTTIKFVLVGLALQDSIVILPILLVFVISLLSSILLYRFLSYVKSVKESYNRQLEGIVKGIIATLELKDPYTRGHSERVADYAMSLAIETGKFKSNELTNFYYTCLLHDIGKINIPDAILAKPGKLTDEEFDLIKQHPTVGAKAVQDVEGISEHIDIISHHHERWDGKGYPDGLKGEEIPYLARVTAVADAFDAMTSSRSYRSALSLDEAYKRIVDGKGTQFDPDLVETFKKVFPVWKDYHQKNN
ncbi:HD-GYP domain-containing protein [Ornithinibacillus halophilus]|uniref:HD-GYP domain, c-di-GMP phosphodiesterase class II (Or its inactivated variant) n=1 Tax=Ornithinibacillus halophilus TaxID=930117 RepID=A0A1M5GQD5_9BACI|nr:HD-GYP domain-containing protein [Ornithinibacillus halophilus]SHG05771.1 HD-GYP domain, c-di-GMP phosphodiesterase class II (or its inactivated variant) [Ornithinibacillus halophilus]